MKLRKIALSLLLIVSMMVAMTGSALAAEPVTVSTLDELTAALAAGGEIVIGANITVPNATTLTIPSGKTVTLDLNGKTISQEDSTGKSTALVTNKGTLTIKDSSGDDSGKLSFTSTTPGAPMAKNWYSNTISNYGTITIESGTIENACTSGSACYALDNYEGSTATINGGKLTSRSTTVRVFNWGSKKTTLNITDGTITSEVGYAINTNTGNTSNIELNISGGTISTNDTNYNLAVYVYANGSAEDTVVNISGGTFDGYVAFGEVASDTMIEGNVSISGGSMDDVICWGTPTFGFISGGDYAYDPLDDYIVTGKDGVQVGDRWYLDAYTVTYTDGVDGEEVFADQVITARNGAETPAFDGTPTREGYTFEGWSPAVAETVTADATYTAQWKVAPAATPTTAPTATPAPNAGASAPAAPTATPAPAPKTGDNTNLVVLSLLMVAAFIGIVVLSKKRAHN